MAATATRPPLSEPDQREITRLCASTGLLLMQHGAESTLVESLSRRLGLALGVETVEIALMSNAITLSTRHHGHCITTVRRNEDRGINMHMVTEVQRSVLMVEKGELDRDLYHQQIESLQPLKYPRLLVVALIGLSCACFARLGGADLASCAVAGVASAVAMAVRQQLGALHFNPMVNFFLAAFAATSVAVQDALHHIGEHPKVSLAASVLLLVPGFPLINGVSDMVKGYINTGIARLGLAMLLAIATCGGVALALQLWGMGGGL